MTGGFVLLLIALLVTGRALAQNGATVDLQIHTATYLGGEATDVANAVDVAPDGSVVIGGQMTTFNPGGVTPVELLGGGDGAVIRLSSTGESILSVTRLGDEVRDLEINDAGNIVVCGDFGVAVLTTDAGALLWSAEPGEVERCAIGQDGVVAALAGDGAYVYGSDGSGPTTWTISGSRYDIAVDAAHGRVIATGFEQVSGNLQVAYLRAWQYDGTFAWKSYDYDAVSGLGADTRGERIAMGRDGFLYFAGTINGGTGVSIFSRDPKNVDQSAASKTVKYDAYNDPFNTGSVKMTWYGRYDAATGDLILGQSLLTRLSSGKGNSIAVKGIMADVDGRLYLAGGKSADLENREQRKINGNPVGGYEAGEGYLLIVAPDFRERMVWTPFAREGFSAGGSGARGVAVRNDTAALALTQSNENERRMITTGSPLQAEPAGGDSDAYVVVWPKIGGAAPTTPTATVPTPTAPPAGSPTAAPTAAPTDSGTVVLPSPTPDTGEPASIWLPLISREGEGATEGTPNTTSTAVVTEQSTPVVTPTVTPPVTPTVVSTSQPAPTTAPTPDGALSGVFKSTVPPDADDDFSSAEFSLWIPEDVPVVRGVIMYGPGCGASSLSDGAPGKERKALAEEWHLAFLGMKFEDKADGKSCGWSRAAQSGADVAAMAALVDFAEQASRPELAVAPWLTFGMSGGAGWAMDMAITHPARTIASFPRGSGSSRGNPPDAYAVPIMLSAGENDGFADGMINTFNAHRPAGALWALAITPNEGHTLGNAWDMALPFFDAVLAQRLPAPPAPGTAVTLLPVDLDGAWLGSNETAEIAAQANYGGDPTVASWLPDGNVAALWQNFVRTGDPE